MVEITNKQVFNFEGAIRGMRQPFKATARSRSEFGLVYEDYFYDTLSEWIGNNFNIETDNEFECVSNFYEQGVIDYGDDAIQYALITPDDLELAQRLIKLGSPHDKFLRQILVSFDINAPLYW